MFGPTPYYLVKRVIAYLIDYTLAFCVAAAISFFTAWLVATQPDRIALASPTPAALLVYGSSAGLVGAIMVAGFGITTGIWGRTPGKWLLALRVQRDDGTPIGPLLGIVREGVKLIVTLIPIAIPIALYGMGTRRAAFYDDFFSCHVEDGMPWGLTETQRKWRRALRHKQSWGRP